MNYNALIRLFTIREDARIALLDLKAFALQAGLADQRSIQQEGKRVLLHYFFPDQPFIQHLPNGKPFVQGKSAHISLSHSHDYLVMMVDDAAETGIDIELIRPKVLSIRHKFLDEQEQLHCEETNVALHICYWAAKETLFKIYGHKGVSFVHDIKVAPFEFNPKAGGSFKGKVRNNGEWMYFLLSYECISNYVLVYKDKHILNYE